MYMLLIKYQMNLCKPVRGLHLSELWQSQVHVKLIFTIQIGSI